MVDDLCRILSTEGAHGRSLCLSNQNRDVIYDGTSGGISLGPLSGGGFVTRSVFFEDSCDFGDQWVVRIGVGEERADREEHFGDRQGWAPLIAKDVQADASV